MTHNKHLREYLAVWAIPRMGSINSRKLISYAKGIENVFKLSRKDLLNIPGFGEQIVKEITGTKHFELADKELEFIEKFNINTTTFFDTDYPYRLKQSEDAPLLYFSKGQPVDDTKKFISIVGTRNATPRGIDVCTKLVEDLKNNGHDVVIVSGLAFGIDIAAHTAALNVGLPTIGVLGHGLKQLYPAKHRKTAAEMIDNGSLISEFFSSYFPDKNNFVRRNRIIAGLSDATIVVESDVKGGSLITADIANSYNRDVFAVPGRLSDKYSSGCNKLIKTNRAALLESVDDIEYILGWDKQQQSVQKQLFVDLSPEEEKILKAFDQAEEQSIDQICRTSGFNMSKVSSLLLTMEFSGLVKCLPGKVFVKC